MKKFIQNLIKAELHMHIEGSLEPEMLFRFARRNNIKIPFQSINEVKQAYRFANLQQFLDIYYQGMSALITEEDYFELTYAYLEKAHANNVLSAEIFFDPQAHLARGIQFGTVITGISNAIKKANITLGIQANLIMCFLRHLPETDAIKNF